MLTGPALSDLSKMVARTGLNVIASGGVRDMEDIGALRKTGVSGVIIGKALYDGKVALEQCWPKESSPAST